MISRRVLIALVVCGCTETVQLAPDPLAGLVSLDIAPSDSEVDINDLAQPPQDIQLVATGHFTNGETRDVTAQVQWSVDNAAPGHLVAPGTFETSKRTAGYVMVTASGEHVSASARVTVRVNITVIDPAFPPPSGNLFDPSLPVIVADAQHSPELLYPAPDTVFPQGLSSTLFQYATGTGNVAFRLAFDSDVLHVAVLTAADRWAADGAMQELIAGSGIAAPVQLTIKATAANGSGLIYSSAAHALRYSADDPGGLIAYWSAATNRIVRGGLGITAVAPLYPSAGTCGSCHAIARSGTSLALGYGGETLQTVALPALTPQIPASAKIQMGWATYSPDGARIVVANKGLLTLLDAATGQPLGSPDGRIALPAGTFATHPDWSPDGSTLAVAYTMSPPTNMDVKGASIALLPVVGDSVGPPSVLVAATGMENDYFPKWSPDGRAIAFVHATQSSRGAASAELQVVDAATGNVRALRLASHRVGVLDDVPGLADTMPTWAPAIGDHAWLAFTSIRGYGAVLPSGGRGQIWVAAIDTSGADDPSSPAFWLPCQDITVLNNNPVWSSALVGPTTD